MGLTNFRTHTVRNSLDVADIEFPLPSADVQSGPFYSVNSPIRIVRVTLNADPTDIFSS